MAILNGDANANILTGGDEADTIYGLEGNDRIFGMGGSDLLYGGAGDDTLHAGNDTVLASDGSLNLLYGGAGNDLLINSVFNTSDVALYGDSGDDYLYLAEHGSTYLRAAYGGTGNDLVMADFSGISDIEVRGGAGIDRLVFGYVKSGTGPIRFDLAPDMLFTDPVTGHTASFTSFECVDLAFGAERDVVHTGRFADNIDVGAGRNAVFAGAGDDTVSYLPGQVNHLYGGAGVDTLGLFWRDLKKDLGALHFTVDPVTGEANDGFGSVLKGFENFIIEAPTHDAYVEFGAGNDLFKWGAGDDTIYGGAGNDTLEGSDGADGLFGGVGDDSLTSGPGSDSLYGGVGNDILHGGASATLWGDAGEDTLYGGGGAVLLGGGGDDLMQGKSGDRLLGGNGNDHLISLGSSSLDGGTGADLLEGGYGSDSLYGGAGNDRLSTVLSTIDFDIDVLDGGDGDDSLTLGYCGASLTGGAGADQFIFPSLAPIWNDQQISTIRDFESGEDRLVFHEIYFISLTPGALASAMLATDQATGTKPQFVQSYEAATDTTHLSFDQDGAGSAFAPLAIIDFTGHVVLTTADFFIL